MRRLFTDVVLRGAMEKREEYLVRLRLEERGQARPSASVAGPAEEVHACISFDGEAQFLAAAMGHFVDDSSRARPDSLLSKVVCVKFSAACSKTLQPADVSPAFMAIKQKLASLITEHPDGTSHMYMPRVRDILKIIGNSSAFLFARWISLMEEALSDAFTATNIMQGWTINGRVPLDNAKLLAMCYGSGDLSDKQMAACQAAITKLAPAILENGQVTDCQIQDAVGGALQFDTRDVFDERGRKVRKELHEMAVQRRRTVILTATKIINEYKDKRNIPDIDESEVKIFV